MKNNFHHVMIGLPEAGKTTYLAALWHVLCSNEVDGSLTLARLEGNKSYLNEIRETWARASTVGRTNPGKEPDLSFILADESGNELEIHVPDLSGEAFEADWVERSMRKERAAILSNVSGAMLFINPKNVRSEVLISAVADDVSELEDELDDEGITGEQQIEEEMAGTDEPNEWRAEQAPTQIQLVDLLQILLYLNERRPISLVVVVSAWDEIKQTIKPESWVKRELPLLWQFLKSNPNDLNSTYLGISAQGGDLAKESDRLKGIDIPSERISVVSTADGVSHDITRPLRWLMTQANQ